ncbi:MAG: reverse transcriptase/maturase family protein [Candidatus Paceibacterota bacterium]|jgi:retron-type reverse transcriptase
MKIQLGHKFEDIADADNLLEAWREFLRGKGNKPDVQEFSLCLMNNILSLHRDLINHKYKHGGYRCFKIKDPKARTIHKASVRDRLLHHAAYRLLYPFFDRIFISDSFSCRKNRGTHKSLNRFRSFACIVSKNNTKTCWILKGDVKKFFASVDQDILLEILRKYIPDEDIICLLREIIFSFRSVEYGTGLPLGNLTSQLFANVYMNEFDQFVKHKLKIEYYIRYADDFVILSENKEDLKNKIGPIGDFLRIKLKLTLHPDKIFIKTLLSGMDFLGWKHFFNHRIIRNTTRLRAIKRIKDSDYNSATLNSYFGLLGHGNTYKIRNKILNLAINKRHS